MAFFPPSLSPNNRAYISDDKRAVNLLERRFMNHNLPCVVYWPWLSWDGIDFSTLQQQLSIARCILIGESGFDLPCSTLDTHGAVIHFGVDKAFQSWELIHYFRWNDEGVPLKKFEMCWLRLWKHGTYLIPDNPVPIAGGGTSGLAVDIALDVLYETVLPPAGSDFSYFAAKSAPGGASLLVTVSLQTVGGASIVHIDDGWPSPLTYSGTIADTGQLPHTLANPGLQLRMASGNANNNTVRFKVASV